MLIRQRPAYPIELARCSPRKTHLVARALGLTARGPHLTNKLLVSLAFYLGLVTLDHEPARVSYFTRLSKGSTLARAKFRT